MSSLKGKFAIVTGGTRGIGRGISLQLASEGAHVVALFGRDSKSAADLTQLATEQGLDIICIKGDLANEEKFKSVINEIFLEADKLAGKPNGQVDILVHCAASGVHRPATELTLKHLRWTFEINVFAIHNLLCQLLPRMHAGGRVIGLTSSGGTRVIPYYAAVGSSKGALESLFRHYAYELAPKGIAVNLVCPGLVLTEAVEAFPEKEARIDKATSSTPTGHLTSPEEIAQMVSFLCQPSSSQIIGQTFVIDGGKTLLS